MTGAHEPCNLRGSVKEQDHGRAPTPETDPCFAALMRIRAGLSAIIEAQRAEGEAIERLRTTLGSQLSRFQDRLDAMIAAFDTEPDFAVGSGGARR